ncbi:hypothetical protein GOBAR_AA17411 [Gossypium barbadense]|uniref:1-phosphatidylinositol 4-kinase n=1 Tax=Gossypium barbadense TaxID=3634 RepID=A0A2P5XIW9_GOSBA|nr:hypothetical protein GOBAR_AA17411 [Gossypium barbadense]
MSSAGLAVVPVRNEPLTTPSHISPGSGHCESESICVYLAFSGSMIPMRILESDSIESLKLRIQTCKGFVVKNQKLVCGGRELARSNSLVRDYGVNDGNVLHLVLKLSDLQVINVKTSSGKEFTFHVRRGRGCDVGYVKRQIAKREKWFTDLDEQEVVFDGERLEDQRLIDDICKHNDAVLHLLVRKSAKVRAKPVAKNFELSIMAPKSKGKRDNDVGETNGGVQYEADRKFVPRKPPERDFILEPVIVNPKVQLSSVIVKMIKSTFDGLCSKKNPIRSMEGTGGAYFMQDSSGQKFVSVFKPIDEEPLAINNPRKLPMSSDGEGLKKFEDCTFDWLYWPQARQLYSSETLNYIKSLDAEKDIALLKYLGWDIPPKCARTLRISTMLLKKGAARALTPYAIGSIMCRENLNEESVIEEIVQEAEESVLPNTSEAAFLKKLSQIMDCRLDEIAGSHILQVQSI